MPESLELEPKNSDKQPVDQPPCQENDDDKCRPKEACDMQLRFAAYTSNSVPEPTVQVRFHRPTILLELVHQGSKDVGPCLTDTVLDVGDTGQDV